MDDWYAMLLSDPSCRLSTIPIDRKCAFGLVLSLVYRRVGGGINNNIWSECADCATDRSRMKEVDARPRAKTNSDVRMAGCRFAQRARHLPFGPYNIEPHHDFILLRAQ